MTCTYAQEIQNFANWFQYYRSREFVTKASIGSVIAGSRVSRRLATTGSPTSEDVRSAMNDCHPKATRSSCSTTSTASSPRATDRRSGSCWTAQARRSHVQGSDCPALPAPAGICQRNFALLMTDGYWTQGTGVPSNADADGRVIRSMVAGMPTTYSATLADTAMYWYKNDLWTTLRRPGAGRRARHTGAPEGTFGSDTPLMHQHMKTYTIAFGVEGTIDEDDIPVDPTTAFAWPDPSNAPAYKIDDMLHSALNGRGQYLNASNPRQLQSALENAFLEFTQAASSTSSAAFNSTSLEEGTLLYRGFYDLRYNIGELTATRVNLDGYLAATPLWKASESSTTSAQRSGHRDL